MRMLDDVSHASRINIWQQTIGSLNLSLEGDCKAKVRGGGGQLHPTRR